MNQVQTIEQAGRKFPVNDALAEVYGCGGDDPDAGTRSANVLKLRKHFDELILNQAGHVLDTSEEQRSAGRSVDEAGANGPKRNRVAG